MPTSTTEPTLIAAPEPLRELIDRVSSEPVVAIDTEFVRERTYFAQLCVLQVATRDEVAAVDCLAELDLEPLIDALVANDRIWILHSARQDLEVLTQRFGQSPAKLIDTQIAAALIGHPLQVSLQKMLIDVLDVALGKEHTRADWSRRPLSADVLRYALDDVRYLLPAWRKLESELGARERLTWFEEDCERLLALPVQADLVTVFDRTKGSGGLKGKRRAAGLALVEWREDRAVQRDKPRRWILPDDVLVAIAAALPQSVDDLKRVPGVPPKLATRSGNAIVAAIANAKPTAELPSAPEFAPPDKALVKSLQAQVRSIADQLGVPPELLATKKEILQTAAGSPPVVFTHGWRGSVLAPVMAKLS